MADSATRWSDLATCEARNKLACTEGLAAPKTAVTPQTTEACAAALEQGTCPAFLSGVMPPDACTAKPGPGTDGSACSFSSQCSSGFCALADDALCGTCQASPAAGDSCATHGCGPNMNCVRASMTCQVPVAAAGTCSRMEPCGQGLACVGATLTANGTCMTKVAVLGAACDPERRTGPDCDASAGLACDSGTLACVARPTAAAGEPCGAVGTTTTVCAGGATCEIAGAATTGTCVAPAADGAACNVDTGPDCLTPAKCVAGTCQLPGSMTCS